MHVASYMGQLGNEFMQRAMCNIHVHIDTKNILTIFNITSVLRIEYKQINLLNKNEFTFYEVLHLSFGNRHREMLE